MFPFIRPQEAGDRDAELVMDLVFPEKAEDFRKVLKHLKNQGIEHADLHSGNILLDTRESINAIIEKQHKKEMNFYIIDFGKINIDEERVKKCHPEIFSHLSR
jgi:predicted unusual protein kinase regulating ubiquinone biosynthesis (AarF/ABC1/UbiB family)